MNIYKRLKYDDIFRGNIEQTQKDAQRLLKSSNDKLIWIDGNSIWGYVSLEQLKEWIKEYPDKEARENLITMCKQWKMNSLNATYGYVKKSTDVSLWNFIYSNN